MGLLQFQKARLHPSRMAGLLVACSLLAATPFARAANVTFTGGVGSGGTTWQTTTNWSTAALPTSSDVAIFSAANPTGNIIVLNTATTTIGGVLVTRTQATTLGSNGGGDRYLQVGASGITIDAGAGAFTSGTGTTSGGVMPIPIVSQTWTNNSSNPFTVQSVGGPWQAPAGTVLTLAGSGNYVFDKPFNTGTTSGNLIWNGTGKLSLSRNNQNVGGFTLNSGTVLVAHDNALGATNGQVTGTANGTVTLNNSVSLESDNAARTVSQGFFLNGNLTLANNQNLTLSSTATINLGAGIRTITVADSGTRTLAINSVVSNGGVTKSGVGILFLGGSNTYALGTTISGGAVAIGNDSALGSGTVTFNGGVLTSNTTTARTISNPLTFSGSGTLGDTTASGTLTFTGPTELSGGIRAITTPSDVTISGTISNGGFTKAGAGRLTLSGANTYDGATTISEGQIWIADGNALGGTAAGTTVANGTQLRLTPSGAGITFGAEPLSIAGSGGATGALRTASGTNIWQGKITLSDTATITAATNAKLTIDVASGNAIEANNFTLTFDGAGINEVADPVSLGSGGVTKNGSGTLVFRSANTFSGPTTLAAGILQVGADGALGSGTLGLGAGVTLSSDSTAARSLTNAVAVGGNVTLGDTINTGTLTLSGPVDLGGATRTVTANSTAILAGAMSSGGLTKSGAGVLVLAAANSYTGTTTIGSGQIWITEGTALGDTAAGTVVANGAQLRLNALGAGITVGAEPLSLIGNGALRNQSGTNTWQGTITLTGSTSITAAGGSKLTIDVASGNAIESNNFDLSLDGVGINEVREPISLGTGNLTKTGAGIAILMGNNAYSGVTTVSAGTLLVNGNQSASTGAVTVALGAVLGGSGTIGGVVTVNGILSPGSSPGVLSVDSLVLGSSGTSAFEINGTVRGTDYDGLTITGTTGPTYGGTLALLFGNAGLADETTLDLFDFGGLTASGAFSSVVSTGFYAGTWTNNNDGTFKLESGVQTLTFSQATGNVIIVPEPSAAVLLAGMIVAGLHVARRRSSIRTS